MMLGVDNPCILDTAQEEFVPRPVNAEMLWHVYYNEVAKLRSQSEVVITGKDARVLDCRHPILGEWRVHCFRGHTNVLLLSV